MGPLTAPTGEAAPLLRMRGIDKRYGGVHALSGVDLTVEAGRIHAILGENGAGKSSLIKCMSGVVQPEAGTMEVDGRPVRFGSPAEANAAGIVCIFQELSLVPDLSVADNLMDKSHQKSRAISVGMMNFAGCMPFLLELWMSASPNSLDTAMAIILQPKTVVIIYVIAAAGYAIESAVTGMVATLMQQRARARLAEIDKQLIELVDRWDHYVDGSVDLDDFGFPDNR